MSASKLKSYTYDKKILNKLTNQQCKDYIDNYEDKNIHKCTTLLFFSNQTIMLVIEMFHQELHNTKTKDRS